MVCGVAVEIPLAGESGEVGEDSKGNHFAGAEGGVGSGASLLLRAGVAEIVDHNVECGEEGVHIDHGPVPFPLGSGSKPTLVRGHLPLKFRVDNSHQTFEEGVRILSQALIEMEVEEYVGAARHVRS